MHKKHYKTPRPEPSTPAGSAPLPFQEGPLFDGGGTRPIFACGVGRRAARGVRARRRYRDCCCEDSIASRADLEAAYSAQPTLSERCPLLGFARADRETKAVGSVRKDVRCVW